MNSKLAVEMIDYELSKFALIGWTVSLSRSVGHLGECSYRKKQIILSKPYVLINDYKKVLEIGLHEIAHAIVGPGHGHDFIWQQQAIKLGVPATRCDTTAIIPPGKYIAICPSCNKVYYCYRRPKSGTWRYCRRCGETSGRLTFHPNHYQYPKALTVE